MDQLFQNIQVLTEKVLNVGSDNFQSSRDNSTIHFANSDPFISFSARLFLVGLHCAILLLALIGNGWVIAVGLARYRSSPFQHIKKYLINLAVSSIAFGVLCVPFTYTDFLYGQWIYPVWLCPVTQYVQLVSVFVTINTLLIIFIERYTAVRHPLAHFHCMIQSHSHILIGLIWFFGLFYAYIPMRCIRVDKFMIGDQIYQQCNSNIGLVKGSHRLRYLMANFAFTFALPAIVLAFAYLEIARKMLNISLGNKFGTNNDKQPEEKMKSIKHNLQCELIESADTNVTIQSEIKVARITLLVIVMYYLSWMPIKLLQLMFELKLFSYRTEQQYRSQLNLYIVCQWLAMTGTIANPILYAFVSRRFWNGLHRFFTYTNRYYTS